MKYIDFGVGFEIKTIHFGDGYSLNCYRTYYIKGRFLKQLCSCSGGHQTIEQAMNCKEVIKNSAWLVANSL